MSSKIPTCPECGAELPTGAPEGLCPQCLIAAGLESEAPHESPAQAASTTPHSGGFVPPDAEWLASHFPHLEVLELIGSGGMGAVYKARQPRLDRIVALKIIRPETANSPAFAERFHREARTLARLSHPHIVAVYDFGEVSVTGAAADPPKSLYYFLMEYVDGATLRQLLQSGELTPPQALAIVPQVCEALQFAHDEGVVHRDIKPENILLDKRGRVKIADFGLAKLIAHDPNEFTLTQTHQVMGTPRYMAPEQMDGSHAVDHRADIFSLGVVFYEMLTGEVPAGHFEPPSRKVQIDVRLDEVVLRALAREPERRYQHASDVRTDVEFISQSGKERASSTVIADSVRAAKPFAWKWLWVGLGLLVSVAGLLAFVMYWTSSAWALLGLAAWWFALGLVVGSSADSSDQDEMNTEAAFIALAVAGFGTSAALAAYGVALADSLNPLWVLALWISAFFSGIFTEEKGKEETATLSDNQQQKGQSKADSGAEGAAREPERRYQHASDVKTDIESISGQSRPLAVSPAPPAAVENDADGSFLGFLGSSILVVNVFVLIFVLTLLAVGVLLGGEETVESWGIPTTGVWVQVAQLAALCFIIAVLLSPLYKWKWPRRNEHASDVKTDPPAKVGTPVAHVQFSVPAAEDIASRVKFHFSGLGYRIVDERPDEWVFERGKTAAVLYEDDVRLYKTTLTVRTISEDGGRTWVNCHWAVRNPLGLGWFTRRDVETLEAEGRELQVILGGGVEGGELEEVEHASLLQHRQEPEELVKTPALLLKIAGGVLTFFLVGGLGGAMEEGFDVWWPCLVGPIVLFAGMAMGQLRAYWLAVVGSLLCLPAAIFPFWGWFAFGAGMYSLWRLTQPEVREVFRRRALGSGSPSDELNAEPPPRGTLGRAWDEWWAERDQWLTWGVQSVLGIGFFVCLILYLSFYTSSERLADVDDQRLRHTIVTIGVPDPWFKWETYPDLRTPFQWKIDWKSTSTGIMLLGFLAWCVNWQIEKAKAKATGKQLRWWHGSPSFGLAIWGVFTLAATAMGIAMAELPQRLDRRSANPDTRLSAQEAPAYRRWRDGTDAHGHIARYVGAYRCRGPRQSRPTLAVTSTDRSAGPVSSAVQLTPSEWFWEAYEGLPSRPMSNRPAPCRKFDERLTAYTKFRRQHGHCPSNPRAKVVSADGCGRPRIARNASGARWA